MPTIKRLEVVDWRYPTSLKLDGSDAVHKKPDYSCVYMVMHTDDPKLVGHGLTFTCGRGNEIVKRMIEAFEFLVVGKDLDKDFIADPVEFMRTLTQDGQLRWLGPEKGVIGLAVNCITNALWDMWARKENKPFWMLVASMEPEQLIKCIDFHHMTDCITPEEGLALLKKQRPGWEKRVEEIKQNGYPTYTTGAGWLGYSEEKTRGLCRDLMNEGFTHFKMKVGSEKVEDDMERAEWIRSEIGEENVLMMDANQKWDVQTAIASMEKLAKFRPLWIEEPTHADDVCGHRDIARACEKFVNKVGVATGEVAQNKVIFKQLITENAIEFAQIDAGRMSGGPSEILSVILMCLKKNVKVVPHAGGVGLCEYVRQYSFIDYICFSTDMTGRLCEATAHLHEHFEEPIIFRNRPSDNMQCYMPNLTPGFGTMIRESIDDWAFPYGKNWNDVKMIGEDLDAWSKEMRLREQQRACEVLANYSPESNADAKLKMAVATQKQEIDLLKKTNSDLIATNQEQNAKIDALTEMMKEVLSAVKSEKGISINEGTVTYTSRPTAKDIVNSVIVTSEFKLINVDAAGAKAHMKAEGCKKWAGVKGLRSKWFWIDEPTMTMGGVYTFFDMKSVEEYKTTELFKSMWTTPIIDPETLVIEIHQNCAGGEITHEMAQWKSSKDNAPVNADDVSDAWMLMAKFRVDFTANPDVPNADAFKAVLANGGTAPWKDIPGLRTKDFTYRPEGEQGYGFYIFTSKKAMEEYMASPTWGFMQQIPHIKDPTGRCVELLSGTEHTVELGKWPGAK